MDDNWGYLYFRKPAYNHQGLWTLRIMFFFFRMEWLGISPSWGWRNRLCKINDLHRIGCCVRFFTPFHIPGFCWFPTPLTLWGCRCHFSCSLATSLPSLSGWLSLWGGGWLWCRLWRAWGWAGWLGRRSCLGREAWRCGYRANVPRGPFRGRPPGGGGATDFSRKLIRQWG